MAWDSYNDEYLIEFTEQELDEELQKFAQWLWDSNYLVDEALTIRLVDQYKEEQK